MAHSNPAAWLLIAQLERAQWTLTAAPSTAAQLGGQLRDDVYTPGILLGFSQLAHAARAALRFQEDLRGANPDGQIPAIVLGGGSESPGLLSILSADLPAGIVLVTSFFRKQLLGEPLEFVAGPSIHVEGQPPVATFVLRSTSYNMGWALPAVDLAARSAPPPSPRPYAPEFRKLEPVINIHVEKEKSAFSFLPVKFSIFLVIAFIGLIGAYRLAVRITRDVKIPGQAEAPASEGAPTDAAAAPAPTPTVVLDYLTPKPERFGSIIVETEPDNAMVFLNERFVGMASPVVVPQLKAEETHKLTVKAKGREPYTNFFNIDPDENRKIQVKLSKR